MASSASAAAGPNLAPDSSCLDNFLDDISDLRADLKKQLCLMRELDDRCGSTAQEIDAATKAFHERRHRRASNTSPQAHLASDRWLRQTVKLIREKQRSCIEICDEKVQLSRQLYEMVDSHIQHLDRELAKLEGMIQCGEIAVPKETGAPARAAPQAGAAAAAASSSGAPRKKAAAADRLLEAELAAAQASAASGSLLEMPVDPNEPTYCLCNRVSFGNMVACDNDSCPREWFHYECVGLLDAPVGKWYCPECAPLFARGALQKKRRT